MEKSEIHIVHEEEPLKYTDTGAVICASTVSVEADAIKVFTKLICNEWNEMNLSWEKMQDLYSALAGLEILTTAHAKTAEELADMVF